ncbi:MAG: restriction endonuclease subunit S [Spirochaetaceae bacterium]|nr:restriction endonuclease subunit S [Spirochaetaceae bacterium]
MHAGWLRASLTEVCEILDHRRVPVNNRERDRRVAGVRAEDLYPYYGSTGQVGVIDDFIFDGEHILLGEDGAPFLDPLKNKAYLVTGRFWVNNHAHILRAEISNKYVCHYLNVVNYSYHVTGTTRLKLTKRSLGSISIPIPSMAEQLRIVAKIEELFSELDIGIESLKEASTSMLEKYNRSWFHCAASTNSG